MARRSAAARSSLAAPASEALDAGAFAACVVLAAGDLAGVPVCAAPRSELKAIRVREEIRLGFISASPSGPGRQQQGPGLFRWSPRCGLNPQTSCWLRGGYRPW